MKKTATALIALTMAVAGTPAMARELATLTRLDAQTVELGREDTTPVSIWISTDTKLDKGDQRFATSSKDARLKLAIPAAERRYVILEGKGGRNTVVAERVVAVQQGSNFRDIGGYVTKSGKMVKWDKAFRSGAMPLLSDSDYALLGQLGIGNVVDFRSLEEREVAPDQIDDRTGALFLANDYSLKPLMANFAKGGGENVYKGMEKMLAPQYRAMFKRLIANEGAVLYHCSAGQDRTGIATALLYDVLGVDRDTIVKDYHLSTALRRPQYEMPKIDPRDYPDNPIVQYYFQRSEEQRDKAEPLFTKSGASHIVQFFAYIDSEYGGSEGYLKKELGFTDAEIETLRANMLA